MAEQIILPRRVLDANGDPLSGAKLYAYVEGTTTLEAIYTTSALSTAHPSPLVSDSGGNFPPIWHAGDHGVKIKITDASDVEISWSPLDPCPATSSATTASNISFTPTTNNPASNVQDAIDNASDKGREILNKASNYTVLSTDRTKVIRCTADLTLSLSAADVLGAGWFTQIMADGGDVTIDPDGSETIEGDTTKILYDGEDGFLHCDGASLYLIRTSAVSDVVIASGTISGGSVAEIVVAIPTEFEDVEVEVFGFVPVSNGAELGFQVGTGTIGSPTWQTSYNRTVTGNSAGTVSGASFTTTYLPLSGASNSAGGYVHKCSAKLGKFNVNGYFAYLGGSFSFNTAPQPELLTLGGSQGNVTTRTLMRLLASTGNIADLTYTIKGKRA